MVSRALAPEADRTCPRAVAKSSSTPVHAVIWTPPFEMGCDIVEYTPAEVKRAVVGYGRAEKQQVQRMIKLLLGLEKAPTPFDASDALAIAICHLHARAAGVTARPKPGTTIDDVGPGSSRANGRTKLPKSWRQYRPPAHG